MRATIAPAPPRLAECLADLTSLHRHVCPRQVLGVRMGLYAMRDGVTLCRDCAGSPYFRVISSF